MASPAGRALSSSTPPAAPDEAERCAVARAGLADIRPATDEGLEAVDAMVAMTFRIDDCRAAFVALAAEQAEEAATDWDHARKVEAEATAEGLRHRPGTAAAKLGETRQGAELMLGRWESLRKSLDQGTWDESDRSAALDLLGVDRAFRAAGADDPGRPRGGRRDGLRPRGDRGGGDPAAVAAGDDPGRGRRPFAIPGRDAPGRAHVEAGGADPPL